MTLLRQMEVEAANGKTTTQACKEAEIAVQTFCFTGYIVRTLIRPNAGRLADPIEKTFAAFFPGNAWVTAGT